MFKKISAVVAVIAVTSFTSCVGVDPDGRGYSVAIPMGMINSKLANQFPVQEKRQLGTVTISDPNVLSKEGSDKLGIGTSFKFTNFLVPNGIGGNLKLASGVRFDPKTQNLYFANPMVEELKFHDFSLAKYLTDDIRQSLGVIIAETISKKPIYNIQKAGVGSGFVKGIDIRNGKVFVTFGL